MPQNSMTDLSAVRPRGPKFFVAALILAAVAGAVWFFFFKPPGPRGAPENATVVIVVGGEADDAAFLTGLGFAVQQGTLAELEAQAAAELDSKGATGPGAVLELADERGAGFVAFADPSALAFGDLAVSPESADINANHNWATFSIGDFAQPHVVTVALTEGGYPLPGYIELLRALFAQPRLAATLVGAERVSVDARPVFDKIEPATTLLGAYGMIDLKARKIARERGESLDEPEEASPPPATLADPLERTSGFPVANGGLVLYSERPRVRSPRDDQALLEYPGFAEAFFLPRGKTATSDRLPCVAPPAPGRRGATQKINTAGDAMLVKAGDATQVWLMPATASGCPFEKKGTVGGKDPYLGSVNSDGRVLQRAEIDGESGPEWMVELWTPGESQPQVWPLPGCTSVDNPEWIGGPHFAVVCNYDAPEEEEEEEEEAEAAAVAPSTPADAVVPSQDWLYLVSTETGQVLAWPVGQLEPGRSTTLHHRPHAQLSVVLETVGEDLSVLTAKANVTSLFSTPPADEEHARPAFVRDAEDDVLALRSDAFESRSIRLEAMPAELRVSPTGTHAALDVDSDYDRRETNVAVLDLTTGKTTRVAINRWAGHRSPHFTPDGTQVVFVSTYDADDRTMTALRLADVP